MAKQPHEEKTRRVITRAKAEATIARLDRIKDEDKIKAFLSHKNKHVISKANYKLAEPEDRPGMTAAKKANVPAA